MLKNVSIKIKLSLVLFGMMAAVALISGIFVYRYTQEAAVKELYTMNRTVLKQISKNAGMLFSTVKAASDRLVYDSNLNEILNEEPSGLQGEEYKEKNAQAVQFLSDLSWSHSQFSVRFDIYVRGKNGYVCSTDSSKNYEWNLQEDGPYYSALAEGSQEPVLVDTFEEPNGIGAYHYVFQVVRNINDLITGETIGLAVINVSEKLLYDTFSDMNVSNRTVRVVNKDGKILSCQDKREIGRIFEDWDNSYTTGDGYRIIEKAGGDYLMVASPIPNTQWYLVDQIPQEIILHPMDTVRLFLILFFLMLILAILGIALAASHMLTRPILNIRYNMGRVMEGNLSARTTVTGRDEIGQLGVSFNAMVSRLEDLLASVKEEEQLKRKAELDFLRAQINPHFIYNTLSSIRCLVAMEETQEAERMIYQFTKLLRNTLSRTDEFTTVDQELKILEIYGELQQIRYPESFSLSFEMEEAVRECLIPAFLLQPVVENAIFHGMEGEKKICKIQVRAFEEQEALKIVVQADGQGMPEETAKGILVGAEKMSRIGLKNVHERLQLVYGSGCGVQIESCEGRGTRITLIMKKM